MVVSAAVWSSCTTGPEPGDTVGIEASLPALVEQIAALEYRASENGEGLQAPNRAQNLRTYFESTGIRVHDRTAPRSPELLRLSLAGVGRGHALAAVEPGREVAVDGHRVEIRRPGLVEWFENRPEGLEQGFTLAQRPAGEGRLRLELALEGAQATQRGEQLIFATATGRKLSYRKLAAFDAGGRPLAAEFSLVDRGRIALSIEDASADVSTQADLTSQLAAEKAERAGTGSFPRSGGA